MAAGQSNYRGKWLPWVKEQCRQRKTHGRPTGMVIWRRCSRENATSFLLLHEDSKNLKASLLFFLLKWCATFTINLFTVDSLYNQVFWSLVLIASSMMRAKCFIVHLYQPHNSPVGLWRCRNIKSHVQGPVKAKFGRMMRSLMYLSPVKVLVLQTVLSQFILWRDRQFSEEKIAILFSWSFE